MEEIVSYEQIERANKNINTTKIGNKEYATVNERVKAFRQVYPTGGLPTELIKYEDGMCIFKCNVYDENGNLLSTGMASEKLTGNDKKDYINLNSMLENCETSAVGRALGFAGFGIDNAIASGEDIERNKELNKRFEIATSLFIKETEAVSIIKNAINELIRKMGVVKTSLENKINEQLWTSISRLNLEQFQRLENKLKTINMSDDEWHDLYHENLKIKDVVPENQEVVYEGSWNKFGKLALKMAGSNEELKNQIIDEYLNMGIDLTNEKVD